MVGARGLVGGLLVGGGIALLGSCAAAREPVGISPRLEQSPAVQALAAPIAAALPIDAPLPDVPNDWSLPMAYALQSAVVKQLARGSQIAGYKAGLMDAAGRARFGASEPVSGVLFMAGRGSNGTRFAIDADDRFVAELEIGVVLARDITEPLADDVDALTLVRDVVPVVELPNLNLVQPPSVADIVGSNVSAWRYLVGRSHPPLAGASANALTARLVRDGVVIAEGRGDAVYGDQRAALRWLILDRLARGERLEAGQLLITGTMTPPAPIVSGSYRAEFGELGVLEFTVVAEAAASDG